MQFFIVLVGCFGAILCDTFTFDSSVFDALVKSKPWKPLCDAVTHGKFEDVQEVLEMDTDVNLVDDNGMTALHYAALKSRVEMVELLLKHGASCKAVDREGNTPLHLTNNDKIVDLLTLHHANLNAQNHLVDTALHKAAFYGYEPVALMLMRNGADCNIKNNIGNTAINSASLTGREKMVDELYQFGADVNVQNKQTGNTPFHSASINGYGKIVDCLIRSGAMTNIANLNGNTPIHFSVKYGHELVTDMLLQNFADRFKKNKFGKTPIDVAIEEGNGRILNLLRRNSSAAAKACSMFATEINLQPRILGGELADNAEFPWMAAMGYRDQNNRTSYDCGGTIISQHYAMTAAHCVKESRRPILVRVGSVNLTDDEGTTAESYEIQEILRHPYYSITGRKNDIALIRVKTPFRFSDHVKPACLRTERTDVDRNMNLTVTGFGRISKENRNTSNKLLKANLQTMPLVECNTTILEYNKFANQKAFRNGIHVSQYCVYDPDHKSDSCEWDSGGPLQNIRSDSELAEIVGVVSYGIGCGSVLPSIYTRVSYFLYWIETVVWPNLLNEM